MKLGGYGRLALQSRGHDNLRNQTHRERVMSHLRGVMLGCMPFLLSAGTGLACDNSSLNGVYPFTASGFTMGIYDSADVLHYLDPPQPLSSVGQYTFDGRGNFIRVDFPVGNGIPVSPSGFRPGQAGTYSIGEDCTGHIDLNANGSMITLQVVVGDSGSSARAIVASEHVPGFATPPPGTSCSSGCDEGVNILVDLKRDIAQSGNMQ